jgi:peptidoglycan/xylan/chitin deacetylase (PgdA/CDA1 family)
LCQEGFGSCQADAVPAGTNLSGNARPLLGDVPYGEDIYDCTVPGVIALTFDDGPGIYTDGMLDVLESYNAVASFMITGINNDKGEIDITPEWIDVINRTYNAGHQICSHTWSHQDLSTLSEAARRNEMYKNEMALVNIIGRWPTYMRPPYSSCDDPCRATMKALGYHIMYFDIDTDDYDLDSPDLIQTAKNTFESYVGPSNTATDDFLVIAHDIHQQTAQNLTAYMLETLIAKGYKPVTIGQCLGDPEENWYRIPDGATPSNPDPTPTQSPLPSNCVYTVNTWCATPLPTYTNIGGCWNATGDCYPQGDVCYNTVGGEDQVGCDAYDDVCVALENHCDACVSAAPNGQGDNAACQYVAPAYPTSIA